MVNAPPPPTSVQPVDSITTTSLAQEVARAWGSRVGSLKQQAPPHAVLNIFNDLHLYPTKTQVFEMLVCARQCSRRRSLALSFGEFCVLAAELRKRLSKKHGLQKRDHSGKLGGSQWEFPASTPRTPNGGSIQPGQYELFLGGSCNPTTWRKEIAIPILEEMGITYFNPQVSDWSLELVEVEWSAKQQARALLFVLDSETRAVAASVEAAHLAALGRDLLLVLRSYSKGQKIGNDTITDLEYSELSRARSALAAAVERRGLPVFNDIESALKCARVVLRGARRRPPGAVLRLRRAFEQASGRRATTSKSRAARALESAVGCELDVAESVLKEDPVDFDHFCAAASEISEKQIENADSEAQSNIENLAKECLAYSSKELISCRNSFSNKSNAKLKAAEKNLRLHIPKSADGSGRREDSPSTLTPRSEQRLQTLSLSAPASPITISGYTHDIYLADNHYEGGTHHLLKAAKLSIYSSQQRNLTSSKNTSSSTKSECLLEEESILSCRVLLFPITSEAPCLTSMVLAAHYMAIRPQHTVLLIQNFTYYHGLSENAVKDYNRGRHYLRDLAARDGITITDDPVAAVAAVKHKLTQHK